MPSVHPAADGPASASARPQVTTTYDSRPNQIPDFSGKVDHYKKYRSKMDIYALRMKVFNKEETVGLNIAQGMTGHRQVRVGRGLEVSLRAPRPGLQAQRPYRVADGVR